MLGYRCYYDSKSDKYRYENKQTLASSPTDLEWWNAELNLAKQSVNAHNNSLRHTELELAKDMNKDSHIILKCKDCGKLFVIYQSEYDWYKDRQLDLPKRCDTCRRLRKKNVVKI